MICSKSREIGATARFAVRFRATSQVLCALALFWSVSATAQAGPQCTAHESQVLESPNPTSVVWGADGASSLSVAWGNDLVNEDSVVWGDPVLWGADGSEEFDTIGEDSVVWGNAQDDSVCNVVAHGDNQFN